MKYCPVCQQAYADETLNFCLEDGSHLVTEEFISNSPTLVYQPSFHELVSLRSFESQQVPSIAVLPFSNVSSDPENEYFCDGLAEELINAFMKLDKLRVAARTSAFSFKGKETDVRHIGQALNVNTVLEGSVRKAGNRLRITAQLINVADGYQLWSERFDRQLEDIFEIQEEIALAIIDALKVKLLGNEKAVLRKRYTDNVEAYQLYLKGRLWNRRTADGFKSAIGYFQKAIELDADYAVAYSGLVDYHVLLGFYEALPPSVAGEKAKAFATKALKLDDTLAETHSSYGATLGGFDWNWTEAREHYKTAIEINPNYLAAHQYYAINLAVHGRFEEVFEKAKRSLEIDPLLPIINANLAWFYYLAREYEQAAEQARLTVEIDPNNFSAFWILGLSYAKQKKFDEAATALQNAVTLSGNRPFVVAELGRIFAEAQKKSEARAILKKLDEASKENYISPLNRAKIYLGLGEDAKVFEWLEKGFEERSVRLPWLLIDPQFDEFRADRRFIDLTKKIGIANRES
ncbi:MAG TPA: tetratricopeptide repeat protein [Pyrinomonadaceae bacterium]|jgi:TolB-like protein/Flp pilus assembly protein TadD